MRATRTQYSVAGWGDGELWMLGGIVLAHDFSYVDTREIEGSGGQLGPRPPKGAANPPSGTLEVRSPQVAHAFAPTSRQTAPTSHQTAPTLQTTAPRSHEDAPTSREARAPDDGAAGDELAARLADYLAGNDVALTDVELDLSWATPFQRAVADALRAVPRGEVVAYGELAALAGYPGGARAVGSFCARNRFALLVPCHRVVGAAGLGSYGATGLDVKRRLLALEGVVL